MASSKFPNHLGLSNFAFQNQDSSTSIELLRKLIIANTTLYVKIYKYIYLTIFIDNLFV